MPRKYEKRGELQDRICEVCQTAFKADQWKTRHGYGRFCSWKCFQTVHSPPKEQRFWSKVDRRGPDDCWEWQASRLPAGYGQIHWGVGRPLRAHRLAWELTHGPIPPKVQVLHKCDNPPCCNPAHLFLGKDKENVADMRAKGRAIAPPPRPQNHKLTPEEVVLIRWYAAQGMPYPEIAPRFKITAPYVGRVVRYEVWKRVR